ncbi:MAG: hypothetical protein QM532_01945 [Cyanobium sp. MAG06]|nr:hypothetical protein [Cyanobium sp. MAG06]
MDTSKYLDIINKKKYQKEIIKEYIEKELKIKPVTIIIDDIYVSLKTNSSNRFILNLKEANINGFIKEQGLFYKNNKL